MSFFGAPLLQNPLVGATLSLLPSTVASIFNGLVTQWGVFDSSGNLAITPDTFFGVDAIVPNTLSDAPLEAGSFTTYNKVKVPNRISVRMAAGGSVTNRSNFLATLDQMVADTNLYTIVTPEKTWANMNCTTYDLRREASRGAGLVMVNCLFEEVRAIQTMSYSSLVPNSAQTNPATYTGMPSPTDTVLPSDQADTSVGGVTPQPLADTNSWGIAAGSDW